MHIHYVFLAAITYVTLTTTLASTSHSTRLNHWAYNSRRGSCCANQRLCFVSLRGHSTIQVLNNLSEVFTLVVLDDGRDIWFWCRTIVLDLDLDNGTRKQFKLTTISCGPWLWFVNIYQNNGS